MLPLQYLSDWCLHGVYFEKNSKGKTSQIEGLFQALAYQKQGCATIACLILKFRGYRHVKSCMPPTK